jgi:hypothetical protein
LPFVLVVAVVVPPAYDEKGISGARRTVGYLAREGALVSDEGVGTVRGVDFYRITQRGLELLEQLQPPRSLVYSEARRRRVLTDVPINTLDVSCDPLRTDSRP